MPTFNVRIVETKKPPVGGFSFGHNLLIYEYALYEQHLATCQHQRLRGTLFLR
jgi:hypothetical protein